MESLLFLALFFKVQLGGGLLCLEDFLLLPFDNAHILACFIKFDARTAKLVAL